MLNAIDNLPNREYMFLGEAATHTGIPQRAILQASSPPTWLAANGSSPPPPFVPTWNGNTMGYHCNEGEGKECVSLAEPTRQLQNSRSTACLPAGRDVTIRRTKSMVTERMDTVQTTRSKDGTWILNLSGEHDITTATELRDGLDALFAEGTRIVVDLRHVAFMDSTIIGVLAAAQQRASTTEGEGLALVVPSEGFVARLKEIVAFDKLIPTFNSLEEAERSTVAQEQVGSRPGLS